MKQQLITRYRICFACGETKSRNNQWYMNHDSDDNELCARCNDIYRRAKRFFSQAEVLAYARSFQKGSPRKGKRQFKSKGECYGCGRTPAGKWYYNHDTDGNILCATCRSWVERRFKHEQYAKRERRYRERPEVKQRDNERSKRKRDEARDILFGMLGTQCIECGENRKPVLQFDHVGADAGEDKKRFGNRQAALIYYSKHPEEAKQKLQVLCASCNFLKLFKNNEFKHRV